MIESLTCKSKWLFPFLRRPVRTKQHPGLSRFGNRISAAFAATKPRDMLRLFMLALILHAGSTYADLQAPHAGEAPRVDGLADDHAWTLAEWHPVGHRWLGPEHAPTDFAGRFKVVWTEQRLYVLFEFVDDILIDTHRDPLVQYWDDDTLEVFIDEDRSGGDHQYNHNAFAYHFSLDNQAIDIGTDKQARSYTDHVESSWRQHPGHAVWEVSMEIYPDSYTDDGTNRPVPLKTGKIMGFMLAYCDNDGSELRENFVGSTPIEGPGKDRGWIDADVFDTLVLVR